MSKKTTWADVAKGDELDFDGRTWRVAKIKAKGKRASVKLERKGQTAEDVVKLTDRVTRARQTPSPERKKREPLTGPNGQQQRWATDKEAEKAGVGIRPGNPEVTSPPAAPSVDVWETPINRTERVLQELMHARLVGETDDENAGHYVPPVDVSTVAAHLVLFHGGIPEGCADEGAMMTAHAAQHDDALKGDAILEKNHWHTATRPEIQR